MRNRFRNVFQFPSNGKAHSDDFRHGAELRSTEWLAFQFPSNGKAHSDTIRRNLQMIDWY